ncbi:MAG: HAD family hydrolase [Pseudoruminococcus massiliensis]|jgi:HAD superfamily hydrolase (TIGR01549 family)|uniref:HAD family hydrolase n=1 Tax=Pseudoruminococcus massiliensis TaxID=2086583 RepID=UPI003995A915|nr:HAD family hydrolase [Oscillospiraceae bacterium]
MKKWLFFDVGSTLVDETECEKQRIIDTINGSSVSYDEFYHKMEYYACCNMNCYKCTLEKYGLKKADWKSELEIIYPKADYILNSLSVKYNLGIIANQNKGLSERLRQFGIYDYFNIVVSSSDIGFAKPDERIFKFALKKANCSAQNAYMIGDRFDNDIIPAQHIGMKTVWIKQGFGGLGNSDKLSTFPDYIVENLSELLNLQF